jgi:hypothetical protein
MFPPKAERLPVNGRTSPIRRVNEQLGFAAFADGADMATPPAIPATRSVAAARLAVLDVSTGNFLLSLVRPFRHRRRARMLQH